MSLILARVSAADWSHPVFAVIERGFQLRYDALRARGDFPLPVNLPQRTLGGLPDGAVFILEGQHERTDGTRFRNLAQGGGGGLADVVVRVFQRLPEELRGAVLLDAAECFDGKFPHVPGGIMDQRCGDVFDDAGITHPPQRFNRRRPHEMIGVVQKPEQGSGGLGMPEEAERFRGGDANMAVLVAQGAFERPNGAGVPGFAQRGGGGVTSGTGKVLKGVGQKFHGLGAMNGSVLVLAGGDGAQDEFDVGARTPAQGVQRPRGLPANGMMIIAQGMNERVNRTGIANLSDGINRRRANFRVAVLDGGDERRKGAIVMERTQGLGGGNTDFRLFIRQRLGDRQQGRRIDSAGHFLDHAAARARVLRLKPL